MLTKIKFRHPEQLLLPWSPSATISAGHAARLLNVSSMTILRMIEAGELKAYQVRQLPGSPWRINYDSVVAYLQAMHKDHGLEQRF
jgi:excisionase family DNA binding protein